MSSSNSGADELAASVQRGVLGVLLAILVILGVGLTRRIPEGDYLVGSLGVVLAIGAGLWVVYLFYDGILAGES